MPQLEWCLRQQRAAIEHMRNGCNCMQMKCDPRNVHLWLNDSWAEELELLLEAAKVDVEA